MQELARIFPSSVEINSENGGSIVSIDYTIGVEHRNDLENKLVSEIDRLGGV